MRSSSANAKVATVLDGQTVAVRRSVDYGGLVGDLLTEIETRMATPASVRPDAIHTLSIASGYVGLLAGFVATGMGLVWLVS